MGRVAHPYTAVSVWRLHGRAVLSLTGTFALNLCLVAGCATVLGLDDAATLVGDGGASAQPTGGSVSTSAAGGPSGVSGSASASSSSTGNPSTGANGNECSPQCALDEYCDAPTCKKKKPSNAACSAGEQCQSGSCPNEKCAP